MPAQYTQITLAQRPKGHIDDSTFKAESTPYDFQGKVGPTQVLVKVLYVSVDPAMRGWLNDTRSYVPPVGIGEVMRASGISEVIEAGSGSQLKVGQLVHGRPGWSEYAVLDAARLTPVDLQPGIEPLDYLDALGGTGLTAYFGLNDIIKIKAGETLLVSGAAGAVGTKACQLGLAAGAKVYAIAGSPEKVAYLEKEIGVERAFNYKSSTFRQEVEEIGYINAYFDNVGGEILDLVLTRLQKNARIALCGAISVYSVSLCSFCGRITYLHPLDDEKPNGISNYLQLILQRASIQGFIVTDYEDQFPSARASIARELASGKIKRKFTVVEGLENAPKALSMLFTGGNTGKLVVKVA